MSFFWAKRHSRMHSLQKTWPFWQHMGSIKGFKQRQQASNGLIESLPSRSLWVPYPSFRFSSYVKKARSLLFFECLWGISPDQWRYRNPNWLNAIWSVGSDRTGVRGIDSEGCLSPRNLLCDLYMRGCVYQLIFRKWPRLSSAVGRRKVQIS